ncbi:MULTISPECIES: DUF7344 domain-containing protein [Halorussus]|uniref:DUF7344 domain-containing protein n=1 Tax=Halorussus TaxID=1070314 RepID=UPI0020A0AB8C|nr:hypothetical protein [Halorussus vallis]USZ76767.1 hypothetical protein NGM07_05430 [Halorussus vallis]
MSSDNTEHERYLDVLYSTLSHPHRRIVLRYLLRHPGRVPVADLAAEIDLFEADAPVGNPALPAGNPASLVGLHHVHLPKLLDAGLVELESTTRTVSLSPRAASVPLDSRADRGLLDPSRRSAELDSE